MKILTVCEGGAVRSVGLANYLKHICNPHHDAIAVSWAKNSEDTLRQFCDWADLIVVMEKHHWAELPSEYRLGGSKENKVKVCDVGRDTYGTPFNRVLQDKCAEFVREERL